MDQVTQEIFGPISRPEWRPRARSLTPRQVAKHLQVSEREVLRWLRGGDLRGLRTDNEWRVSKRQLNAFLEERANIPVQVMLPIIMKAVASTQDGGENVVAIEVAVASVDLDQAGEVLLTLENTAGAHVCYGLSRSVVVELSALLESALQHQSGSKSAH